MPGSLHCDKNRNRWVLSPVILKKIVSQTTVQHATTPNAETLKPPPLKWGTRRGHATSTFTEQLSRRPQERKGCYVGVEHEKYNYLHMVWFDTSGAWQQTKNH